MRSRATAALTLSIGVLAGACANPSPSEEAADAPAVTVAAIETTGPQSDPALADGAAVMVVEVAGDATSGSPESDSPTSTADPSATSAGAAATVDSSSTIPPTTGQQTTTTAGRTTTTTTTEQTTTTAGQTTTTEGRTTTTGQTTTTKRVTTTQATSTTPPDASETRPEILAMALPIHGGGTFDPNSLKDRNVLVWFWGPY